MRGEHGTMAANQSPDKPQVFRSPTAVVIWVVWLLFAVGQLVDLAVQGRDHVSAVAAAILLLATGVAYVTAQRPRIIADKTGLTVRNPLRDHRIGWAGVAKVDLADLLRVHCRGVARRSAAPGQPGGKEHHKVISAWAVHYSRRRQFAAEARARRPAPVPGAAALVPGPRRLRRAVACGYGARGARPRSSTAEAEAEKVVRVLSERATAARAEAVWASGTAEAAGSEAAAGRGTAGAAARTEPAETGADRAAGTAAGTGRAGRHGNRGPPREPGPRPLREPGSRPAAHGPGRRRLAWLVRAAEEHLERPGHRRPRHSRADPAAGLPF